MKNGLSYVFSQLDSGYYEFEEIGIKFSIALVVLRTNFQGRKAI